MCPADVSALGLLAAPDPSTKVPATPASVAAARRLPDFLAPSVHFKEIRRIVHFKPGTSHRLLKCVLILPSMVPLESPSATHTVAVLVCKLYSAGGARAAHIVSKFCVILADKREGAGDILTHSNCVDDITNRLITTIAPAIGALQDSIDVGGAYFYVAPPSIVAAAASTCASSPGSPNSSPSTLFGAAGA